MRAPLAGMDRAMTMPSRHVVDLLLLFAMWWVMMVGMMLPGVAPVILTFATVNRNRRARAQPYVPAALFAAGYLLAWGGFSLAAALAQWALERAALLSPMDMTTDSRLLGGLLFIAAGLYQFTPVKFACLRFCRSPLDFVVNHWRAGRVGALRLGFAHGLYFVG
jgi:predicted metal-binding membrane protein